MHTPLLKKAPALKPQSRIALCSPAGGVGERRLAEGVAWLESQGYCPRPMPHAADDCGYLAGTDADRASDLMMALLDPTVDAILFTKGGYGCAKLLPLLDWQALVAIETPKLLMGFSDITVLLTAFYHRLGWVGLYSPMLASNLIVSDQHWTREQWHRTTTATVADLPFAVANKAPYEALRGEAGLVIEAPLYVANLTLLASLCGTPWQPRTDGHLLVLEDWKESDYSLDRQFNQLKQAGLFDNLAGLLFADWSYTQRQCELPLPQLLASFVADKAIPAVGFGWMCGHGEQTTTLPIGTQARWDVATGKLSLVEPWFYD